MLGGLAAGWLVGGSDISGVTPAGEAMSAPRDRWRARPAWQPAVVYASLGAMADGDFLLGTHSTYSHSLGAVFVAGAVAALLIRHHRIRFGLACAAAYGTHVLLDWLGSDTSSPIGIMALWPFTDRFYQSSLYVFEAISRRYWLPGFWMHNALAVTREILILVPVVALVLRWRLRCPVFAGYRRTVRRPQNA
jgi:hypothetical protein